MLGYDGDRLVGQVAHYEVVASRGPGWVGYVQGERVIGRCGTAEVAERAVEERAPRVWSAERLRAGNTLPRSVSPTSTTGEEPVAQRGYKTIKVTLKKGEVVPVYASPRVADALEAIMDEMPTYEGVKLMSVLEAVYSQGKKDGARSAFDDIDRRVIEAKATIKHANPGRPKKKK